MVEFFSCLGLQVSEILGSPLYKQYENMSLYNRNKLIQAQILRYSLNTLKNHVSNMKKYSDSCENDIFPVDKGKLHSFLVTKAEEGFTFITIEAYYKSIKFFSQFLGYEHLSDVSTKNLMFFLQKVCKKNKPPERKGFRKSDLETLYCNVSKNGGLLSLTTLEKRSFMIILFCYCTMARFNCLKEIRLDNLFFFKDYVKICIPKSKTDQTGKGQYVFLINLPKINVFNVFAEYIFQLRLEKYGNAYLFPSLKWDSNGKSWYPAEKSLSYSAAYSGQKRLLKKFGFDENCFSLHSCRIGATTDSFKEGMPLHIIDKRGRWKDPTMKYVYTKETDQELVDIISKHV